MKPPADVSGFLVILLFIKLERETPRMDNDYSEVFRATRPPSDMVAGRDAQLERAIQYCLDEMAKTPPSRPSRPPYKVQVTR